VDFQSDAEGVPMTATGKIMIENLAGTEAFADLGLLYLCFAKAMCCGRGFPHTENFFRNHSSGLSFLRVPWLRHQLCKPYLRIFV